MEAIIKETGQAVEVVSRFMPKKRNAPSRDWMCNLSNGTCINESELEYISDNIEDNRIIDIDNVAREYAENHYSEWEETWYDYDGYNAEPENDKLELIDAFKAGAKWQAEKCDEETSKLLYAERQTAYIHGWDDHKEQMLREAVEFECIGKKVKMTIQELINYYIDQECCDVADECGF